MNLSTRAPSLSRAAILGAACAIAIACGSSAGNGNNGATGGDGGTASTGPTGDQACSDWAASVCGRLQACAPFIVQVLYGDVAACAARTALPCKPGLMTSGTQATPTQVESCAQAISTETCDEALDNTQPSTCVLIGALTDGSACATGAECQSGYCKIVPGTACGVCARQLGLGSACSSDADCLSGLICGAQGACISPSPANGPCGSASQACLRTLTCSGRSCRSPSGLGSPCSQPTDCDGNKGLYCNVMSNQCAQIVVAPPGGSCGVVGNDLAACSAAAACVNGSCVSAADDGQACDARNGPFCLVNAQCAGGKCSVPDPTSCK